MGDVVKLHLGVVDQPYAFRSLSRKRRNRPVKSGEQTTGDVATFIENRYAVMETFFDRHKEEIAGQLEKSIAGALENLLVGAPISVDAYAHATAQIEHSFRHFLTSREMDGLPGVPTQASIKGVNHRLKIKRGANRPSFVDTGLFLSSFHAWVE